MTTMTTSRAVASPFAPPPIPRGSLTSACDGPLLFGSVHEDPELELEALAPSFGDRIAIVSSGGCTALSLLACGARDVTAIDCNPTQNHLVELKHAAIAALGTRRTTAFLGLAPSNAEARRDAYLRIRGGLTTAAAAYWDARLNTVARGVQWSGRAERLMRAVTAVLRTLVHGDRRISRLLACTTLAEQRALWEREWNTRRLRWLYRALLGRRSLSRGIDPACCDHVRGGRFDRFFLERLAHTLTTLPVSENYFLHAALTGRYPKAAAPPYLDPRRKPAIGHSCRLALVDGTFTDFLRTQPDRSLSGFALSNIAEWLDPGAVDRLFTEVARTARDGAVVVFRNFVGWTEIPPALRHVVREERARGAILMRGDRSLVQRRFAVCVVRHAPRRSTRPPAWRVREALPGDNAGLVALAAACPMQGPLTACVERAPDFFALSRRQGRRIRVFVAEEAGSVVGCVTVAERASLVRDRPAATLHVGDLKVAPRRRGSGVADALTAAVRETAFEWRLPHAPILVEVLAGNRAMERRTDGPRGLPPLTRLATVRSLAFPMLRRAATRSVHVRPAERKDVVAMKQLWDAVAPGRQFTRRFEGVSAFGAWIDDCASFAAFRLAFDDGGRLLGFLAAWEQSALKQLRVTADSPVIARGRRVLRLVGPALGLPGVPAPGEIVRCATVHGLCVPPHAPDVLRALLLQALADGRMRGLTVLNVALDERDPLAVATRGLFGLPTRVDVYVCTASGAWTGDDLRDRPLHFESALA